MQAGRPVCQRGHRAEGWHTRRTSTVSTVAWFTSKCVRDIGRQVLLGSSLKVSKILKLQLAAGLVRSRVRPSHRWRQCRWPLSQMTGPPELWGAWATEGEGAAPDKLTCGLGAVTGSAVLWSLNGDRLDSEATAE